MAENVLEKIIKKKNERIVNLKKTISLESLKTYSCDDILLEQS